MLYFDWIQFPTVEHAYQAYKSTNQHDWVEISKLETPGQAKKVGQLIKLRPNWNEIKLDTMEELLRMKFAIPELKTKLLETGDQKLVEGNYWGDVYWGVCRGKGENHLGKLLMKIRSEL